MPSSLFCRTGRLTNPLLLTPRRAILGILGSFFSGSTTISNLTFAQVQYVAAQNIGVNPYSILALQAIGGTAGNAVCINNIISGMLYAARICDRVGTSGFSSRAGATPETKHTWRSSANQNTSTP
jgi:hypothetical protein